MLRYLVALVCDVCKTTAGSIFDIDDEQQLLNVVAKSGWKVRRTAKDHTWGQAICTGCAAKGHDFP